MPNIEIPLITVLARKKAVHLGNSERFGDSITTEHWSCHVKFAALFNGRRLRTINECSSRRRMM